MGYLRRHAIIVVGDDYQNSKGIMQAHEKATEIFPWVSPICPPQINGERSFFIPPDGSKEGWTESDAGDKRRDALIAWLKRHPVVSWVEVLFADEQAPPTVTRADDLD